MKLLYLRSNIQISLDENTGILTCDWLGFQDEDSLRSAGQAIHKLFIENKCSKILNDNTHVVGPWNHSTEWTSNEWFPSMIENGLKKFAWIFARDLFAQLSANKVIPTSDVIRSFPTREEAYQWLNE